MPPNSPPTTPPNSSPTGPFEDVLAANRDYSRTRHDGTVPGGAARGLAVVTCMDARLSPLDMLGLAPGDAKVLRNAGAQVSDDVLRDLVIAVHVLGVERVMVVAHTDCRMTKVNDVQVHEAIAEHGIDTRSLRFATIADQLATLRGDVQRIRSSPYLPAGLPVAGCLFDIATGLIDVVVPPG